MIFDICREEYFTPSSSFYLCVILSSDTETLWYNILIYPEAVVHSCSVKKVFKIFAGNFTGNHRCEGLFFLKKIAGWGPPVLDFVKKETPALVFSSELCKHLRTCKKRFVLTNFLNFYHIELPPRLISFYNFLFTFFILFSWFSWFYVFIDMYRFIFIYAFDTHFVLSHLFI